MAANPTEPRAETETTERDTDTKGAIADLETALHSLEDANSRIIDAAEKSSEECLGDDANELCASIGEVRSDLAAWLGRLVYL